MKLRHLVFKGMLEDGEAVIGSFRRLLVILFFEIFSWILFVGGVVWGLFYLIPEYAIWGTIPFVLYSLYKVFFLFMNWYLNTILMTTDNIIFVEWDAFFHRRATVINYWNLDELQVEKIGILAFIRNYGDVTFLKLNTGEKYVYKQMAHPYEVVRIIHNFKEKALHEKNFTEEVALKELISDMVQTHTRQNGVPEMRDKDSFDVPKKQNSPKLYFGEDNVEYEKELDDLGGIDIDLEDSEE